MTDEEFKRRVNRDFNHQTVIAEGALVLVFVLGVSALIAYLATT